LRKAWGLGNGFFMGIPETFGGGVIQVGVEKGRYSSRKRIAKTFCGGLLGEMGWDGREGFGLNVPGVLARGNIITGNAL